jgi:hypothetical protein
MIWTENMKIAIYYYLVMLAIVAGSCVTFWYIDIGASRDERSDGDFFAFFNVPVSSLDKKYQLGIYVWLCCYLFFPLLVLFP